MPRLRINREVHGLLLVRRRLPLRRHRDRRRAGAFSPRNAPGAAPAARPALRGHRRVEEAPKAAAAGDLSAHRGVWVFASSATATWPAWCWSWSARAASWPTSAAASSAWWCWAAPWRSRAASCWPSTRSTAWLYVDKPRLARFEAEVCGRGILRPHPQPQAGDRPGRGHQRRARFLSRVAVEVHTGLTADCTGLAIDEKGSWCRPVRPSAATSWPASCARGTGRRCPRCARTS